MATGSTLMSAEDLEAMPDDGMDRWLVAGELRERPMTRRNRFHSELTSLIAAELVLWVRQQPIPPGKVFSGEVGIIVRRDPDTLFGVDVAYLSREVLAQQGQGTTLLEGVPTLVVEILSPSDMNQDVNEKIDAYLAAGVPLVWIVDPRRKTIVTYRPGAEPELVNVTQEITGEPHLPGFRVPVARLFE